MKINYRTEDNKLNAKSAKAKLAASALEKTMDAGGRKKVVIRLRV